MANLESRLESLLGKKKVKFNQDLTNFSTLKVRARAKYFFKAKTKEELILAKKASLETGLALIIIGGGSNLVFAKGEVDKLVVKNAYIKRGIVNQTEETVDILFSSGYPLAKIVRETINQGYGGFEYHFGLPGSLGGAVYMNSKWTKPPAYIGDSFLYAFLINEKGEVVKKEKSYFRFRYGYSRLQDKKDLLLEAVFRLRKVSPLLLKKRAKTALKYRLQTQPQGVFTSGCFFKNITKEKAKELNLPTLSAGYLIDKAGLKGAKRGRFFVSPKHANFIINQGGGKMADLLSLISLIKAKVRDQFNVNLVEEVELV